MPLDLKERVCMSNLDKSADRNGLVSARSITVFIVSCLSLKSLLGPSFVMCWIIIPTSQNEPYLGCGGLE